MVVLIEARGWLSAQESVEVSFRKKTSEVMGVEHDKTHKLDMARAPASQMQHQRGHGMAPEKLSKTVATLSSST